MAKQKKSKMTYAEREAEHRGLASQRKKDFINGFLRAHGYNKAQAAGFGFGRRSLKRRTTYRVIRSGLLVNHVRNRCRPQ